jgi:polyhydroxybutyrate depolymerase
VGPLTGRLHRAARIVDVSRHGWVVLASTLATAVLLAGCHAGGNPTGTDPRGTGPSGTAPNAVPAGSSEQTINVDGRARTFRVYRPASLAPSAPVPVVVMLHGGFGSASQAESAYGWDAVADANHFVVVYPDGVNRAWAVGGGCCGTPGSTGVDDVGFITAMMASLSRRLPVDAQRVYATGISNGGLLAYRLACDTTLFAAIGPDSATLLGACPSPAPVSVIHIHGTADQNIPYDGSQGGGVAKIHGTAVPALVAMWATVDGCATPTDTTAAPVTTSVATCPQGRAVELITIAGAGHQWPGSTPKPALELIAGVDPPSTALNATDTIWAFFAAHPRTS